MRIRGAEIAGGVAILGIVVLLAVTLWPQDDSATVTVSESGDSILATATDEPSPTASPQPTESAEATAEATTTDEPEPEPDPEPTELAPDERAGVAVQVVNGGGATGAAGAATATLEEQSFQPRGAADAVAAVDRTEILHRDSQEAAARTVAAALGFSDAGVRVPPGDDPNWTAFGNDLDVLVVLGPPLP